MHIRGLAFLLGQISFFFFFTTLGKKIKPISKQRCRIMCSIASRHFSDSVPEMVSDLATLITRVPRYDVWSTACICGTAYLSGLKERVCFIARTVHGRPGARRKIQWGRGLETCDTWCMGHALQKTAAARHLFGEGEKTWMVNREEERGKESISEKRDERGKCMEETDWD